MNDEQDLIQSSNSLSITDPDMILLYNQYNFPHEQEDPELAIAPQFPQPALPLQPSVTDTPPATTASNLSTSTISPSPQGSQNSSPENVSEEQKQQQERPANFKCDHCGRGFLFKNNLKAHLRTHTRDRKYTCEVCQKSFIYKESLKNHMLLHSNELPYQCDICGKKFRDRSNRRKHVKNVHKYHIFPTPPNDGGAGAPVGSVGLGGQEELVGLSSAPSTGNTSQSERRRRKRQQDTSLGVGVVGVDPTMSSPVSSGVKAKRGRKPRRIGDQGQQHPIPVVTVSQFLPSEQIPTSISPNGSGGAGIRRAISASSLFKSPVASSIATTSHSLGASPVGFTTPLQYAYGNISPSQQLNLHQIYPNVKSERMTSPPQYSASPYARSHSHQFSPSSSHSHSHTSRPSSSHASPQSLFGIKEESVDDDEEEEADWPSFQTSPSAHSGGPGLETYKDYLQTLTDLTGGYDQLPEPQLQPLQLSTAGESQEHADIKPSISHLHSFHQSNYSLSTVSSYPTSSYHHHLHHHPEHQQQQHHQPQHFSSDHQLHQAPDFGSLHNQRFWPSYAQAHTHGAIGRSSANLATLLTQNPNQTQSHSHPSSILDYRSLMSGVGTGTGRSGQGVSGSRTIHHRPSSTITSQSLSELTTTTQRPHSVSTLASEEIDAHQNVETEATTNTTDDNPDNNTNCLFKDFPFDISFLQ